MPAIARPLHWGKQVLDRLGEFVLFCSHALAVSHRLWIRRALFWRHCEFIGVSSTPIVVVAALFMGAVLGYQLYFGFHRFGAEALLGGTIGISVFRELGPVLAAIMVAGRAGAAIAAEISSMRITEQIDALEVMAVDPIEYLVTPRIYAGVLVMPILGVIFSVVASISSALIACGVLDLPYATFLDQYVIWVDALDITLHCVSKCLLFGFLISTVACYFGFNAKGGAAGVGLATRSTVVVSCLVILLGDYLMTSFLPFGLPVLKVT